MPSGFLQMETMTDVEAPGILDELFPHLVTQTLLLLITAHITCQNNYAKTTTLVF